MEAGGKGGYNGEAKYHTLQESGSVGMAGWQQQGRQWRQRRASGRNNQLVSDTSKTRKTTTQAHSTAVGLWDCCAKSEPHSARNILTVTASISQQKPKNHNLTPFDSPPTASLLCNVSAALRA